MAVSVVTILGCGSDNNTEASPVSSPTSRAVASPTAPAPSATVPAAATTAPAAVPTEPAEAPAPPADAAITVTMADFSYTPESISVTAGEQVELSVVNDGQVAHTFTIAGLADSGIVGAAQTRTVAFTPASAGSLTFFCTIHGAALMSGQITVTP
jgi:plastocyanin